MSFYFGFTLNSAGILRLNELRAADEIYKLETALSSFVEEKILHYLFHNKNN